MLDRLHDLPVTLLERQDYHAEYWQEYKRSATVFWKLERAQTFREAGDPSWEAFAAGDWDRALELNEADRADAEAIAAMDRSVGVETRRIRVVDHPISPYVQWEMHFLRFLAQAGQSLRVLSPAQVRHLEPQRPLPEIVTLSPEVMHLVRYDTEGNACGAWRVEDPAAIARCRAELAELFAEGEPLLDFFDREIAPLPPPAVPG